MGMFRQEPVVATLLQGVTQALARTEANDKRQDHHEDECGDRYKEITRSFEKLSDKIDTNTQLTADQTAKTVAAVSKQTVAFQRWVMGIGGAIIAGLLFVIYNILHTKGTL